MAELPSRPDRAGAEPTERFLHAFPTKAPGIGFPAAFKSAEQNAPNELGIACVDQTAQHSIDSVKILVHVFDCQNHGFPRKCRFSLNPQERKVSAEQFSGS